VSDKRGKKGLGAEERQREEEKARARKRERERQVPDWARQGRGSWARSDWEDGWTKER